MRARALCVPILGLLLAAPAGAALIYSETFNTDGAVTRYTVTGGGISGPANNQNYWARASTVNAASSPAFTGALGDYWAARDLDDLAGATHAILLNSAAGGINLSGYTGITVSLLLAASTGQWDSVAAGDFVRLYAVNAVTNVSTLLDTFSSVGGGSGVNLQSQAQGTQLGLAFARFTYAIPISIGALRFRFEAGSTGDLEIVGFDDVLVEGTVVIPEPHTAGMLVFGLALLLMIGRRRPVARPL